MNKRTKSRGVAIAKNVQRIEKKNNNYELTKDKEEEEQL
jgi:hypothetical protein